MSGSRLLSDSLCEFIDGHVEVESKGAGDPLYASEGVQRLSRLTRSAETRAGLIIERAVVDALGRSAEYKVLTRSRFPVTEEAQRTLAGLGARFCLSGTHLPLTQQARSTQIDLIAIRHRDRSAGVYEIRRAAGRMGSGAAQETLHKLACSQMLLRAWVVQHCGITVENVSAHLLLYFGNREDIGGVFPDEMILTAEGLDAHFGQPVRAVVDAAHHRYSRKVEEAVDRIIGGMRSEPK